MTLYQKPTPVSPADLSRKVRYHFDRAVLSNEPSSIETNDLVRVGPRVIEFASSRSLFAQMHGCQTEAGRKQMAYTMLAIGAVLLELETRNEMS